MAKRKSKGGLDKNVGQQLSLQIMTGAINQQQLNSASARNMVANTANVLTLGVQMNFTAALKMLTGTGTFEAAAMANLRQSADPARIAAMQAAARSPKG